MERLTAGQAKLPPGANVGSARTGWTVIVVDGMGPVMAYVDEGPPPPVIPGAKAGDFYLNNLTGDLYRLA